MPQLPRFAGAYSRWIAQTVTEYQSSIVIKGQPDGSEAGDFFFDGRDVFGGITQLRVRTGSSFGLMTICEEMLSFARFLMCRNIGTH
jgi:hypothetical protein